MKSTATFFRRSLLLLMLLPFAAQAQVTGISYTAAPVGLRTFYDGNAGLSDSYMYGGALGFGFGEYLEVAGEYLRSYDTKTDFGDFDAPELVQDALALVPDRKVDVERYGGRLRLNIGRTGLLPFITAGTGIIRFDPKGDVSSTESIYLAAGAGLTFSFADRYTLTVEATRMGYRYSPFATFALGDGPTDADGNPLLFDEGDFPIRTVYNTNVRAALRLYLGGRARGEMSDVDLAIADQLSKPRVFVQPFYGRIDFNGKLNGFPKQQPVSGVNAGIDLGPYVGLRGFYWRATDEDELFEKSPIKFRDMQFYGGELNLRFASTALGGGFTPYAILGGGYLNIDENYEAEDVFVAPDSRFFATVGGGLDVPLSSFFRLNVGVRHLLMTDQDLDDLATPSSVYGSWMYAAGVEFSFGGGSSAREVAAAERQRRISQMSDAEQEIERLREQRQSLRAELDSTSTAYQGASQKEQAEMEALREEIATLRARKARVDTVYVRQNDGTMKPVAQPQQQFQASTPEQQRQMAQTSTQNLSGQSINLPVPNVGEIYVRFGETVGQTTVDTYAAPLVVTQGGAMVPPQQGGQPMPGQTFSSQTPAASLSAQQIQDLVRQTIQTEMQQAQGQQLSQTDVQAAVRDAIDQQMARLASDENADLSAVQRLEVRLAEMESRLERRMMGLENQPQQAPVTVVDAGQPQQPQVVTVRDGSPGVLGRQFYTAYPYVGFRAGKGDNQFLLGVRGEYIPRTGNGYRFAPEAAFGFGDGTSFQLFGNLIFPFAENRWATGLQPYAGVGLGLLSRDGLKGLDIGLNLLAGVNYQFGPGAVVLEYSAPNFFDYNRFLLGYRLRW